MTASPDPTPATPSQARGTQGLVARNAAILVVAQAAGMPLSLIVNVVMSRKLGPEGLAYFYLATTLSAFGFLIVEWGQGSVLGSEIARDHARAGKLIGSSLVWRLVAAPIVYAVLALGLYALGRPAELQVAFALVCLSQIITHISLTMLQAMRGFESFGLPASVQVFGQVLNAAFMLPVLILGGGLLWALAAGALAGVITIFPAVRAMRSIGVGAVSFDFKATKTLAATGTAFMVMGLINAAQPNLDAVLLSQLAPAEAVGWHAAAMKVVGVLFLPAGAVVNALYPTLCRLWTDDRESYLRTTQNALRTCFLIGVPIAVGCFCYADTAIAVLNGKAFVPAGDNLRVLGIFVLLVYTTWALSISFAAAGKQRAWTIAQSLCIVISAVLDPLLVPWFQAHWGNGGLGICTSVVVSEIMMFVLGAWIAPPGLFSRALFRPALLTVLAGCAMALAARLMAPLSPFLSAPIALAVYGGLQLAFGGIDKAHLIAARGAIARRFGRA